MTTTNEFSNILPGLVAGGLLLVIVLIYKQVYIHEATLSKRNIFFYGASIGLIVGFVIGLAK